MNSIKLDQESEQALILEEAYHLGYHKVKNGCLEELLVKLNVHIDTLVREAEIDTLVDVQVRLMQLDSNKEKQRDLALTYVNERMSELKEKK